MIDAMTSTDWVRALLMFSPLLALLATAMAALLAAAFARRVAHIVEPAIVLIGIAVAAALAWLVWPSAGTTVVEAMLVDRIALAGILIVCASAALCMLMSPSSMSARSTMRPGYYALVLLAVCGMCALISCQDLIAVLIAMEAMSIALYALCGFASDRPQSVEAAIKFFIMNAFATAFYCMGLAFIFGSLGSTNFAAIADRFEYVLAGEGRSVFLFGLAMVSTGFAVKVAAVPFHAWAPDALDGSPVPVALLMATSAKAAAVIAFFRLASAIAAPGGIMWHHLAWGIAVATMLWGTLAALKQGGMKRMLAYSSIANAGFMLMVFPSLAVANVGLARALLMYLVTYCISMVGAYSALVALAPSSGESLDMRRLCGLSRRRPWMAAALALFMLSLAGMPPTLGFFGRYYLILEVARAGDVTLAAVAAAASAISFAYYLKPIFAMYFREEGAGLAPAGPTKGVVYSSALLGVIILAALSVAVFGLFPQNVLAFVNASAL